MSDKIKNRILCAVFAFILAGGLIAHLAWPDNARSTAERRTLAQAPAFSLSAMLSGKFAQNLDDYALDQFPARDSFRTLKAVVQYYLLQQKDNNGVFLAEGNIGKLEYPLSESSVLRAALGILVSILAGTPVGSTIVAADILAFLVCSALGRARGGETG